MRKDLAAKLYADYPHLFWQRSLPRNQSSMHDVNGMGLDLTSPEAKQYAFTQVKQKLGGLRTYMTNTTSAMKNAIDDAENKAARTCELCGEQGSANEKLISMNKKKRQQDTTLNNGVDDGKIKKLRGTLLTTNNPDIRIFEDISNELLREVFEYFDGYEIYYSFFNLNKRFQNLLTSSTLRIKIHTSFISKPIFQKYYTHFIEPYKHRIKSLHLSNPCTMHLFLDISQCSQLENLLLENTESQYLENILLHITSLSNLSSLVIHINDNSNQIQIYNQIFLLSTLKYCKISFDKNIQLEQLPISTNISSSIEHLVIIGKCYLTELHNFLSYLPHLCRLSVKYINAVYNQIIENYSFI
ncbi:unnamed protein product, partial [Adineta steineri]